MSPVELNNRNKHYICSMKNITKCIRKRLFRSFLLGLVSINFDNKIDMRRLDVRRQASDKDRLRSDLYRMGEDFKKSMYKLGLVSTFVVKRK